MFFLNAEIDQFSVECLKNKARSASHFYGKTGKNFPPNGTEQFSNAFHLNGKTSCSVGESNGTVLFTCSFGN